MGANCGVLALQKSRREALRFTTRKLKVFVGLVANTHASRTKVRDNERSKLGEFHSGPVAYCDTVRAPLRRHHRSDVEQRDHWYLAIYRALEKFDLEPLHQQHSAH
jgi:hypothetical protein